VRKVYRRGKTDEVALAGVDVTVTAGEFVAVMGPSGSGKSTLMHLLGGLDTPTEGDVRVNGRSLVGMSRRQLAAVRAREIGFVFQAFNLVPGLSALDNVALPALLGGGSKFARSRAAELLDRVGLGDARDATPSELSGGQQQRIAVARALIMDPAVVLADEPTGNLDSTAGAEVLSLLEGARDGQWTLVLVTHDARIAARADRIVSLRDGQICEHLDARPVAGAGRRSRDRLIRVES
jgi:putative ABC transport system ATP-binding protein